MFYATCLANVNICPLYTAYNQLLPIVRHLLPRDMDSFQTIAAKSFIFLHTTLRHLLPRDMDIFLNIHSAGTYFLKWRTYP